MPEAEKNLAKQIQKTAASIPAPLRAAALEKANTYLSGMADIEALCKVQDEGVEGVICGRAIYTGDLDFAAGQERADELTGE